MFIKFLEWIGMGKKVDLSNAGLDDLKLVFILACAVIGFFIGVVVPWIYGLFKIMFMILN